MYKMSVLCPRFVTKLGLFGYIIVFVICMFTFELILKKEPRQFENEVTEQLKIKELQFHTARLDSRNLVRYLYTTNK
jgi:hypothetical protein